MQKLGPALAQKGRTGLSTATACASKYSFLCKLEHMFDTARSPTHPFYVTLHSLAFPGLPWHGGLVFSAANPIKGIAQPSCFISSLCIQSHARCILCRESVCAATCLQCECMQHMFLCTQPRSTCSKLVPSLLVQLAVKACGSGVKGCMVTLLGLSVTCECKLVQTPLHSM